MWIVAALAAVALVYFARRWWLAHRQRVAEREAQHAAIAARADQQHAWVLAGDDAGVCGGYPPAITRLRSGRPRSPQGVCERMGNIAHGTGAVNVCVGHAGTGSGRTLHRHQAGVTADTEKTDTPRRGGRAAAACWPQPGTAIGSSMG